MFLTIYNIQRYSLHDGSGIRTIVFLKGCPLRCRWCCNPESQQGEPEIFYTVNKCIGEDNCALCYKTCASKAISFMHGRANFDSAKCSHCLQCANICPSKAIQVKGERMSVTEILDIVERDEAFYKYGDGGLTISGGEPLMHGEALIALLREAKKRRLNTAIETCGFGEYGVLHGAASYLDEILFDIKSMDNGKHKEYTGQPNEKILSNFIKLCNDYPELPKLVRTPIIAKFNDTSAELASIVDFLYDKPNVTHESLPYHRYGEWKYAALGRQYEM